MGSNCRTGGSKIPPVRDARASQAFCHRDEEGTLAAGRLHSDKRREVAVGGIAGKIQNKVDHPAPGENLAVIAAADQARV